jgi:hypothetical protein
LLWRSRSLFPLRFFSAIGFPRRPNQLLEPTAGRCTEKVEG